MGILEQKELKNAAVKCCIFCEDKDMIYIEENNSGKRYISYKNYIDCIARYRTRYRRYFPASLIAQSCR